MHTIAALRLDMFSVHMDGAPSRPEMIFPDWSPLDRLGIVIDAPLGGIGGSHLIQIAIAAYYNVSVRRHEELEIYPEIYAFHVGKGWGTHAGFDFWPARREVMVSGDPKDLLDAINDRGITRLVVPDRPEVELGYRPKEIHTALDRIASAYIYDPSGITANSDVTVKGTDKRTEISPSQVIKPIRLEKVVKTAKAFKEADYNYIEWVNLRAKDITPEDVQRVKQQREILLTDSAATETYRRIGTIEALRRMAWRAA